MTFESLAGTIVALAAALTAVGFLLRRLWHFVRLSVHAFETIQRELKPNHGGSTYDLVRRIEERVTATETALVEVKDKAHEAVIAAGVAVNEAKSGRRIIEENVQAATAATGARLDAAEAHLAALQDSVTEAMQMTATRTGLALAEFLHTHHPNTPVEGDTT